MLPCLERATMGWRGTAIAGLVLIVAGMGTLGVGLAPAAAAQSSASGLDLFSAMLPAIQHPRCTNCHGGVNVITGEGHGGGAIDNIAQEFAADGAMTGSNAACLACHDARTVVQVEPGDPIAGTGPSESVVGPWRLAPRKFSFQGKDAVALCNQVRQFALDFGLEAFANHMDGDDLIRLAFEGKRGGASTDSDPPPITDKQFVAAAGQWLTEGKLSCDSGAPGWSGTITRVERDHQVFDPVTTSGSQAGLPISTEINQEHHGTWAQKWEILPLPPRNVTPNGSAIRLRARWTAEYTATESYSSRGVGVASCPDHRTVSIERTTTRQTSRSAAGSAEVDIQLTFAQDGSYTISASPPSEPAQQTVTSVERATASGGCAPEAPRETTRTSTVSMAWAPANGRGNSNPDDPDTLSGTDTLVTPAPPGAQFKLDKGTTTIWDLHRT
jgi:hypothetical protein